MDRIRSPAEMEPVGGHGSRILLPRSGLVQTISRLPGVTRFPGEGHASAWPRPSPEGARPAPQGSRRAPTTLPTPTIAPGWLAPVPTRCPYIASGTVTPLGVPTAGGPAVGAGPPACRERHRRRYPKRGPPCGRPSRRHSSCRRRIVWTKPLRGSRIREPWPPTGPPSAGLRIPSMRRVKPTRRVPRPAAAQRPAYNPHSRSAVPRSGSAQTGPCRPLGPGRSRNLGVLSERAA